MPIVRCDFEQLFPYWDGRVITAWWDMAVVMSGKDGGFGDNARLSTTTYCDLHPYSVVHWEATKQIHMHICTHTHTHVHVVTHPSPITHLHTNHTHYTYTPAGYTNQPHLHLHTPTTATHTNHNYTPATLTHNDHTYYPHLKSLASKWCNDLFQYRELWFHDLHLKTNTSLIVGANHAILVPQLSSGDLGLGTYNSVDASNCMHDVNTHVDVCNRVRILCECVHIVCWLYMYVCVLYVHMCECIYSNVPTCTCTVLNCADASISHAYNASTIWCTYLCINACVCMCTKHIS